MRKLLLITGVVVAAVLAMGINRIVVTDGRFVAVVGAQVRGLLRRS